MKNTKKTIISGTLIAGAVFGTFSINAAESNMFKYSELGSGSVIRANLLNQSETDLKAYLLELNCGENVNKTTETKKSEDKSKEAKCGEGKCGENKTTVSKDTKTEATAKSDSASKENKSKEGKCGEGKCGVE